MNIHEYTTATEQELYTTFATSADGLSLQQAAERAQKYGYNELPKQTITAFSLLICQFKSPFILLLLCAALASFFLEGPHNALIIFAIVLINTVLSFYQEYSAQSMLKVLNQFLVHTVRVRRGGKECIIPSRELVPGDILLIQAGDIVAADIRLLQADFLLINESVLTGESTAVEKKAQPLAHVPDAYAHALNRAFSGTTVTDGYGSGIVCATGTKTVFGSIAQMAAQTQRQGVFERDIAQFSSFVLRAMVVALATIIIVNFVLKGGAVNFVDLIMFALALAVGITPEALPVVTTVTLARGANALSKHKVVVKRLSAIDDLGSIEVLCTDKTGTLTENILTMVQLHGADENRLLLYAALASPQWLWAHELVSNVFDTAVWSATNDEQRRALCTYTKKMALPFTAQRRRTSVIVQQGTEYILVVRGSVDTIAQLCAQQFTPQANAFEKEHGAKAHRVLAVAYKKLAFPDGAALADEQGLTPLGLLAFTDPLKPTAADALAQARTLGITVKILTGDAADVAGVVAQQIGLIASTTQVITGQLFAQLSVEEQEKAVYEYAVFARVLPEQKFRIIQLLQKKYDVGFLGDGVNDVPALKVANVALVVQGAEPIAQEAADIVLLKNSLRVIIDGIKQGRAVFTNTKKYILVTLACNMGNFLTIAGASFFINYLPMLPVQILLVNLLTDIPLIMIATDTVDRYVVSSPTHFNIKSIAIFALVLGTVSSFFDCLFFWYFYGSDPAVIQTNWFIENVLTELVFVFSVRTRLPFYKGPRPSAWLMSLSVIAAVSALILPLTALGKQLFYFVAPSLSDYGVIALITIFYLIITEIVKGWYFKVHKSSN